MPTPSGTGVNGTPAAISDGTGRLNVFVLGNSDHNIYQRTDNNGQWSAWNRVPGQTGNDPAVVLSCAVSISQTNLCRYNVETNAAASSWGPGRMDLFVNAFRLEDRNEVILHTWADNYQWSGSWEDLGTGFFHGTPTAVSWGPGRIDVFVQENGNGLDHKWFDNNQWSSGWENLGGTLTSDPSVASPGFGLLNVYARGSNGDLWTKGWNGGSWSDWIDVGCCLDGFLNSPVAAVSAGVSTVDVFVIGLQGAVYEGVYNVNTGWAPSHIIDQTIIYTSIVTAEWFPVAPPPPPPPTPTPRPPTPEPTPTLTRCQPPCVLPK